MKEITAEATVEAFLNDWVQQFDCCLSVVTYQGSQYTSNL